MWNLARTTSFLALILLLALALLGCSRSARQGQPESNSPVKTESVNRPDIDDSSRARVSLRDDRGTFLLKDFRLQSEYYDIYAGKTFVPAARGHTAEPTELFVKKDGFWKTIPLSDIRRLALSPDLNPEGGRKYAVGLRAPSDWYIGEITFATGEKTSYKVATNQVLVWEQVGSFYFGGTATRLGSEGDFRIPLEQVSVIERDPIDTTVSEVTDSQNRTTKVKNLSLFKETWEGNTIDRFSPSGGEFDFEIGGPDGGSQVRVKLSLDKIQKLEILQHYPGYITGACKIRIVMKNGEVAEGTALKLSRIFGKKESGEILFEVLDKVASIEPQPSR